MQTRRQIVAAAIASTLLAGAGAAHAQEWQPDRPIRLVVPFGPGGATDIVGRVLAAKLSTSLGQQVVVDNRAGAGGIIGTMNVREAKPDGYTLLVATIGFGANQALYRDREKKLPFDPVKDFTHITQIVNVPTVLVVHPSVGAKNVKELLELAKAKPDTLTFGSAGFGTINHLAGELVKATTGLKLTHVPYRSGGASVAAVVGGEISMLFATTPSAISFIRSGQLIPLATSGASKVELLPELPPMNATIPGFDVVEWQGIVGPAGMPRNVVDRLHKEITAALKDPAIAKRLSELGAEPVGSTPQQFDAFVAAEVKKWHGVADKTGMRAAD
jgi:tripartite-type tricarboxylate transporter receptor subunit TctC